MKKWIALALAAALAVNLCGCCCCLSLPSQSTEEPSTATGALEEIPDASRPIADTLPTEGKPEERPTEPTQPTEDAPVEPPQPETVSVWLLLEMTEDYSSIDEDYMLRHYISYENNYTLVKIITYKGTVLYREQTHDILTGNPLSITEYNTDGSVSNRTQYTYDDRGNGLTYLYEYYYEGIAYSHRSTFEYNEEGLLIAEGAYYNDEETYRSEYAYDQHGNLLTQWSYYENDVSVLSYENTYTNGKLTNVSCMSDGSLFYELLYDSEGNEIQRVHYYDGELSDYTTSMYVDGRLVKRVSGGSGDSYIDEWTYSTDGRLLEFRSESDAFGIYRTTYHYGESGELASKTGYNGSSVYSRSQYSYSYTEISVTEELAKLLETVPSLLTA